MVDDTASAGLFDLQVTLVGIRLRDRNVTRTDFEGFTIHIESACCNSLRQEDGSFQFIACSFILLIANDVLHGFGQLADVASFHILANLHGTFQKLVVRIVCQYDNGLSLGVGDQTHLCFLYRIGSRSQDAQHHAAGQHTVSLSVYHLVEGEVITPKAIFLGSVNVRKDHLRDAANDVRVGHCGVFDFTLDVLLFVG